MAKLGSFWDYNESTAKFSVDNVLNLVFDRAEVEQIYHRYVIQCQTLNLNS